MFIDVAGASYHVAEMAHVFAASDDGPRARPDLTPEERGAFENLIVLCANCHTAVDKTPEAFPDNMMFAWKREHANKLQAVFAAVKVSDRASARRMIGPLLAENHAIFERYGPHIEAAKNPESGSAEQWKRKMLTRILPNSRRMLAVIDANRELLQEDEQRTVELFRQHVDDLEAFHIEDSREDASRFPTDFSRVLEG
ncbi:MAG: hypothetical protein QM740_16590 [Acidovorax sp.]